MAEEKKKTDGDPAATSAWVDLLKSAAGQLIPVVLTAGSLIGFVAFAGAVIVWTRLYAIQVPPEQAVKAVPQSELVATGSSFLLLFGFFGVIALIAAYLIDRGGRATPGMSRALLGLLAIEGLVAIRTFDDGWGARSELAIAIFVLAVLVALAATFRDRFATYEDVLAARGEETLKAERGPGPLRTDAGHPRLGGDEWKFWLATALLALALAAGAVLLFASPVQWLEILLLIGVGGFLVVLVPLYWETGRAIYGSWTDEKRERRTAARTKAAAATTAGEASTPEPVVAVAQPAPGRFERICACMVRFAAARKGSGTEASAPAVSEDERRQQEEKERCERQEEERLRRPRPHRLVLRAPGIILFSGLALIAVGLPCLLLHSLLLAVPLGVAIVLDIGVWRVAVLSKRAFMWYGLVVFVSVPLFGTFTLAARNFDEPQVQPVAIIRSTDGPDESIQGIYVTEGSDRVYFANVATEGCEDKVEQGSGRLLWVPKSEVVAMSIGPLQSVDDAGRAALEMAYSLTPDVETPIGDRVSLTKAEQRFQEEKEAGALGVQAPAVAPPTSGEVAATGATGAAGTTGATGAAGSPSAAAAPAATGFDRRLEDAGPAVRPDFGSGLTLVPETASPGQEVELRLSVPRENGEGEGFGSSPKGHILRVGGVPVSILRAGTRKAATAEYVKTTDGRVVSLDKQGPHSLGGHPNRRFVKVEDSRVKSVEGSPGGHPGYLAIAGGVGRESLDLENPQGASDESKGGPPPAVTFVGEHESVPLEAGFLRQAWEPDRIRFRVPQNAQTGVVTLSCGQLASQPLLRVSRPPNAEIAVHMKAGSRMVRFDSRRSSGHGGIVSRRWTIGGLPRGDEPQIAKRLPPRLAPYRVRLTVTGKDGETDTAELRLLRMPAAHFHFAADRPERRTLVRRIRKAVARQADEEAPAGIEIDGDADDVGSAAFNLKLSWLRALNVRRALETNSATASSASAPPVPVKTRAFGESCPVDPGGGRSRQNRRVEVFVLGSGTRVVFPRSCHPGRVERTLW